jgi:hypothetical protein
MALDNSSLALLGHLNCIEFCRETARWSGRAGETVEAGGALFFASGSTLPVTLNGAYRIDPRLDPDELIARADEWFAARGRGYTLSTNDRPDNDDNDLLRAGAAAGLADLVHAPAMFIRQPVDAPTVDAELRWVSDRAGMDDFIAVSDAAYATLGLPRGEVAASVTEVDRFVAPHIQTVLAYQDDRPVAAAQTMLSHGIAGVYWVGTVEEARGGGLGDAVTRAVTNRAFDLGAAAVTLQASSMGEPIYARMGYEVLYRYTGLVRLEAPKA